MIPLGLLGRSAFSPRATRYVRLQWGRDHLFRQVWVRLFGAHPSVIAAFSPVQTNRTQEGQRTNSSAILTPSEMRQVWERKHSQWWRFSCRFDVKAGSWLRQWGTPLLFPTCSTHSPCSQRGERDLRHTHTHTHTLHTHTQDTHTHHTQRHTHTWVTPTHTVLTSGLAQDSDSIIHFLFKWLN